MERYLNLTASFIKRQYYPHLLIAAIVVLFSGGFLSFRNLDASQAAKVMEMYVALIGIVLFTPLFMPEQDVEIWALEKSKKTPMWVQYFLRFLTALAVFLLVVALFLFFMIRGGSVFEINLLFRGAFCEILFLGSIGFFASALTNQAVLGYMLAVIYFAVNIGGGKTFGKFALFMMMKGEYGTWPYWLLGSAALFIGGVVIREKCKH